MVDKKLDPLETIKEKSRFLRGTIAEGLKDPLTGEERLRKDSKIR